MRSYKNWNAHFLPSDTADPWTFQQRCLNEKQTCESISKFVVKISLSLSPSLPPSLSLSRSLSKYRLKIDFFLSLLWQNFNKAYELDMFEHYIKVLLISEKKKK